MRRWRGPGSIEIGTGFYCIAISGLVSPLKGTIMKSRWCGWTFIEIEFNSMDSAAWSSSDLYAKATDTRQHLRLWHSSLEISTAPNHPHFSVLEGSLQNVISQTVRNAF